MFQSKKSQVSIEYLSILGFVLIIIIFLVILSQVYSRQIEDQIIINQVDKLAKDIVDSAESVYYFGEPTKTTITAYIPDNVEEINISNNEISFMVRKQEGITDISYTSAVNISGTISNAPGIKNIQIEAKEGYVWISS